MGQRDPLSLDFYELPEDGGEFSVAGYSLHGGKWHDVENGAWPLERYGTDAVQDADRVTVHYVNPDTGDDIYYTVHGPFDGWDEFMEYVDAALDRYSEQ